MTAHPSEDGRAWRWSCRGRRGDGRRGRRAARRARQNTPEGLTVAVTGPAGLVADLSEGAPLGIDGLLLGVALLAVLVILVIVYRSPLLPFRAAHERGRAVRRDPRGVLPRGARVIARVETQGIMSIIVIGAATDYGSALHRPFPRSTAHHAVPTAPPRGSRGRARSPQRWLPVDPP
ncbi:MMPL family transporter [Kocuria rhizophila]|nr:MMPL family transporter [Kocuria rhizophila]